MRADASGLQVATLDLARDGRLPDFLIHDGHWLGDATALRGVVLPGADAALAGGLFEMGAPCVYLGESALLDDALVAGLVHTYGPACVGVYVPAARMEVSWSLDCQSNADFKTITPSLCEPAWEILRADGSRSGTHLHWWLAAMFERGASSAVVRVDIGDDADLNLCAGLVEEFGERLWFAPLSSVGNRFGDWRQWGKANRLAVPFALLDADADLRAWSEGTAVQAAA